MNYYQMSLLPIISATLLTSLISGCGSSSSSSNTTERFPSSELALDFSLPFSVIDRSVPDVSGISFNNETDTFLATDTKGTLLSLSSTGELLNEITLTTSFTGAEFIGDASFLLSDNSNIYTYNVDTQALTKLHSFTGEYNNIQSVAYREESKEIAFVDNGASPTLVYIDENGGLTKHLLEKRFNNYDITGLQLSEDAVYMGSSAYKLESEQNKHAIVIQTNFNGDFIQAWALDNSNLSGIAVLDENSPRFITSNQGDSGALKTYEGEAPPSIPSEKPLRIQSTIVLDFNQPSGIDYLASNNTLYYVTDFGEIRSGNTDTNELLFEIESGQGTYEAMSASNNNGEIELHLLKPASSSEKNKIETYKLTGELLRQLDINPVQEEHLFESLSFDPSTGDYRTINDNEDARKYLYTINESGNTQTLELSEDYDAYNIAGLDYSPQNGYLYFITAEFEDQNGKNAGLMIIYDTTQSIEVGRYSIVDTANPEIGVENPSGITVNENNTEVYITSDIDDAILHRYSLESE